MLKRMLAIVVVVVVVIVIVIVIVILRKVVWFCQFFIVPKYQPC